MNRVATSFRSVLIRIDASLEPKPAAPEHWAQVTVVSFACFIALLVLLLAFFTDRNGDVDELAMYNPAYMLAHLGELTFPSYPHHAYFADPVIVHPPVHLGLIGLLGRLGFTWYYAGPGRDSLRAQWADLRHAPGGRLASSLVPRVAAVGIGPARQLEPVQAFPWRSHDDLGLRHPLLRRAGVHWRIRLFGVGDPQPGLERC